MYVENQTSSYNWKLREIIEISKTVIHVRHYYSPIKSNSEECPIMLHSSDDQTPEREIKILVLL